MSPDVMDRISANSELMFLVEELRKAEDLRNQLRNFRNDSPVALLRYEAARKAYDNLYVVFDRKLSEAMS